jgi:hypothetical protein
MRLGQILGVGAAAMIVGGCGGMSANECELADWQAVGYEDGTRGRSTDNFGSYRKNCAKHEVAPDFQAYRNGRDAGLREYCQPERGFREGSRGATYAGVCPASLENDFLSAYYDGRTLYELQSAVNTTTRQIANRESRMNAIEKELASTMTSVLADATSGEERAKLIVETKQLAEERIKLENEVDDLEVQLRVRKEDLATHQEQLVSRR